LPVQRGSCAGVRLGFAPGFSRCRNLRVDLIGGKLVQSGFLGGCPRVAKPFGCQVLLQNLQGVLLFGDALRRGLGFRAATSSSGSFIVKFMGIFSRLTRDRKYTRYGKVSPFLPYRVVATRAAPRRVGAPHEHGQHHCHRVPSVACSGFLT